MKRFSIFLTLLTFMACGAPAAQENTDVVTNISILQAEALQEEGLVVLDLRTPGAFNDGHLPEAVNIDWMGDSFDAQVQAQIQKDTPILLYCQSGGRSAKAVAKLEALGYTMIYHMHQGYSGWASEQKGH